MNTILQMIPVITGFLVVVTMLVCIEIMDSE